MHTYTPEIDDLAQQIFDFARERTALEFFASEIARQRAIEESAYPTGHPTLSGVAGRTQDRSEQALEPSTRTVKASHGGRLTGARQRSHPVNTRALAQPVVR
jgi:hypothetical protein